MPPPSTILITGAASGLGLAFLRHYSSLSSPSFHPRIYTLDSFPLTSDAPAVRHHFQLDVSNPSTTSTLIDYFVAEAIFPALVIHCAGIRGLVSSVPIASGKTEDVRKAETLEVMDAATMSRTFSINCIGTLNILQAFFALLHRMRRPSLTSSAEQRTQESPSRSPKMVIMGSRMGSITLNHAENRVGGAGGGYAYRASKAALNAMIRSFVIDVPEFITVVIHPGRVETNLVNNGVKEEGALGVNEVVRGERAEEEGGLAGLIERLGTEDSGRFVDRWGKYIPW